MAVPSHMPDEPAPPAREVQFRTGRYVPDPDLLAAAVAEELSALGFRAAGAPVLLTDPDADAWLDVEVPVEKPPAEAPAP